MDEPPLHFFDGFGVELEYMIVDRDTLSIKPVADKILYEIAGAYESEVEVGELRWSNELVLHVIELKTNGPMPSLHNLPRLFARDVGRINEILARESACLLPTAMHPWMDPSRETHLWPHEYSPVYERFNAIFGCQGHGWSNLQSVHVNLPFCGDEEFGRLHAAIRLVLPIMPALAASSPAIEGRLTGLLDNRLEAYRTNAKRIPSVTGKVIPEPVYTRADYEERILRRMYRDIAPHDPEGILQDEWLNARGAIARFDRDTIEIRVLDVQECPLADLAILAAIVDVLKALVKERWTSFDEQKAWPTESLEKIFLATIRDADAAVIDDPAYLATFGLAAGRRTAGELWRHIVESVMPRSRAESLVWAAPLRVILNHGPLARRIARSMSHNPSREHLAGVYRALSSCLASGKMFLGV